MSTKRIVIADDAVDFAKMLQATLATVDSTFKVSIVPSAEEAVLEVVRQQPDLLITDYKLPGMSGLDLLKKIHTRRPDMPIIVVTGMKDPALQEQAFKLGARGFFNKPLSITEFINKALELLGMAPIPEPEPVMPMPEPEAERPARPEGNIGETIASLRQRLGAQVVLLADERGRVVARAGDFENPAFETEALPLWMGALSAGQKAARLFGATTADSAQVYKSENFELVLAPVGDMALIIGSRAGRTVMRLALAMEEALYTQKDLRAMLGAIEQPAVRVEAPAAAAAPVAAGVAVPIKPKPVTGPLPPLPEPEVEEDLGDLEALFAQPVARVKDSELDAFWDQAIESKKQGSEELDGLNFEQAFKLGLAPTDQ